jgi:hypothetical protein
MMKVAAVVVACLLLAAPLFSEVKEPKTGVSFPETTTVEGLDLALAGVGVRTKFIVKVYAGALYVAPAVKTELAGFKAQAASPNQALYDAIIQGSFPKLIVMHFVRNVGADKIVEAFREGIEKSIDPNAADVRADLDAFLKANKIDMKDGQDLKILLNGEEITTIPPSGSPGVVKNLKLARAVAAIWLGKSPISADLKKGMVSRLPELL